MTIERTTKPAALAVTMAAARQTLRLEEDNTTLDLSITLWLKGVTREAEFQLGRSLISQGWRLTLASFPPVIELSNPPTISVESVQYYDLSDVLQTLIPGDYYTDKVTEPGRIIPAAGRAWPATSARPNAVVVNYTAGYGATADAVPEEIQLYILGRLSEQFDPSGREFKETPQSRYVDRLLNDARTYA